ncbi:MAG TPA: malate dehydrogenase [Candidatus Eisenbacteria bacterium]|jgi:malate dehydrogenase|nr:malate dehydrogenase [Candidatus Eisenbacteria bacterium]
MPKIAVVGAGNVGASAALYAAEAELGDVTLIDILEGVAKGKALDLLEAGPVRGYDSLLEGSGDVRAVKGSDLIIVTAGLPRKPGMSRLDLLKANSDIIRGVAEAIRESAPKAFVILVTNPLDVMAYLTFRVTGFPRERVIGMAGVLDSTRFRTFIAQEIGVSVEDVQAMVLGGHGDTMVPLVGYATVGGIPVEKFISSARLSEIVQRTRDGGAEIVKLLQTGSAFYAPAASAVQMAEAILRDKKRLLPVAAHLEGEYGFRDIYLGVPAILGSRGLEKIVELELSSEEKAALARSADEVKRGIADLELAPAAR